MFNKRKFNYFANKYTKIINCFLKNNFLKLGFFFKLHLKNFLIICFNMLTVEILFTPFLVKSWNFLRKNFIIFSIDVSHFKYFVRLQMIWVSCEGENPADKEYLPNIVLTPHYGFPAYYFPYTKTPGYRSPIIGVQIVEPERKYFKKYFVLWFIFNFFFEMLFVFNIYWRMYLLIYLWDRIQVKILLTEVAF